MDKIHRLHLYEKTGYRKWFAKRYYDRPDGQDISGKLSYTTKMAGIWGLAGGYTYAMCPPQGLDIRIKLLRMAQVLVPSVGMAVAFTCVTYYATNYRKKDDPYNYVLGGAAAGLLLGPASGVMSLGVVGAVALAAVGYAKKKSQLNNLHLMPRIKQEDFPPYITKTWDTTLIPKSPQGNWVKEASTN